MRTIFLKKHYFLKNVIFWNLNQTSDTNIFNFRFLENYFFFIVSDLHKYERDYIYILRGVIIVKTLMSKF